MEPKSRRPGEGDGSDVRFDGEQLEPKGAIPIPQRRIEGTLSLRYPVARIIKVHWLRELEQAALL